MSYDSDLVWIGYGWVFRMGRGLSTMSCLVFRMGCCPGMMSCISVWDVVLARWDPNCFPCGTLSRHDEDWMAYSLWDVIPARWLMAPWWTKRLGRLFVDCDLVDWSDLFAVEICEQLLWFECQTVCMYCKYFCDSYLLTEVNAFGTNDFSLKCFCWLKPTNSPT